MKTPFSGCLQQNNIQYAFVFSSLTLYFLPRLIGAAGTSAPFPDARNGNLRLPSIGGIGMVDSTWVVNENRALLEECTVECCSQYVICSEEDAEDSPIPPAVEILFIVLLLVTSAFFSGLTLGFMGLDKTGLEIVMEGEDPKYAPMARRIYVVRKHGSWLLCTLVLGNVCVNAYLSILTADKFGGLVGLISSTFLIVIFGEILPQALCQRHSLEVGSASVEIIQVVMVLMAPVAWPLSVALDYALGEELTTIYSSAEMKKLLQIHVAHGGIDQDTAVAMQGALQYKSIPVKNVMTPLENTFMLSSDEQLNFETIARIFKTGYSRIPVYGVNKNNVIGLLFVKDLVFIDPEDNTRLSDFVNIFGRELHVVWPDDSLGDVLRELRSGKGHMALVRDVNNEDENQDPFYEVKGIITLEDIIEEIIGLEIIDETDAFVDGTHKVAVNREDEGAMWASLRLLDSKIVDEHLSYDNVNAVTAHLSKNFPSIFSLISESQLRHLVAESPVSVLPTAAQYDITQPFPDDLMYQRPAESFHCTLVLSGKVTVVAGQDNFRSDISSMSLLAGGALINSPYFPDFTAWVSAGPCRCIQISRDRFAAAMELSQLEQKAHKGESMPLPSSKKNEILTIPVSPTIDQDAFPEGAAASQEKKLMESKSQSSVRFLTSLLAGQMSSSPDSITAHSNPPPPDGIVDEKRDGGSSTVPIEE